MPTYASDTGSNIERAPVGNHQAVCVFVHDIGLQKSVYEGRENIRHQVIITWEINERQETGDDAGKRFLLSKYYTLSLSEKSHLRKDLEAWRGVAFSKEELKGFDLERLKGANCFVNVVATENDKRKVTSVTPLPKGVSKIQPESVVPPQSFSDWVAKERAKAVVEATSATPEPSESDDGLPF